MQLALGVLGAFQITSGGDPIEFPSGMIRRLLLMLLADAGQVVADDVLIERLWPETAPPNVVYSFRNQVARLRRLLGADVVVRVGTGYRLDRSKFDFDLESFDDCVQQARDRLRVDDFDGAVAHASEALALVRGPALSEVREESWARRGSERHRRTGLPR